MKAGTKWENNRAPGLRSFNPFNLNEWLIEHCDYNSAMENGKYLENVFQSFDLDFPLNQIVIKP